jgi:acylglycerol lipase
MKTSESSFRGVKGYNIFYRLWEPDQAPARAAILLFHGYAEHAGRYLHVAQYLTDRGYIIYAPDHRNHGRSEGRKGYIERMDYVLDDARTLLQRMQAEQAGRKIFILGHSMGGLMATCFAIRYQDELAGAVLSGVSLMAGAGVARGARLLGKLLTVVAPTAGIQELKSEWLCRDPAVCRAYDEDPLNYRGKVMARTGTEMLDAADWALARVSSIRLPLLVMHGGADLLVEPAASRYLYDHAASADKTLHIFDGMRHEIYNEYGKEEVLALVAGWLDQRSA